MIRYEKGVLVGEYEPPTNTFEEWANSEIAFARKIGAHARRLALTEALLAWRERNTS